MASEQGKTLVMKFGGTSVGSAEAIGQVREIVTAARQDWPRLVVVASAFSGITNKLLNSARSAARGEMGPFEETVSALRERHTGAVEALVRDPAQNTQVRQEIEELIASFSNLAQAIGALGEATPRALDTVCSLGERISVRVLAAALWAGGLPAVAVEASRLIVTDENFQSAVPDLAETEARTRAVLGPLLAQGQIPVVTGFIGATPSGVVTTLGRGGSDYSAALLGAALPADEVWIWTDVDGVMTADPRIVPEARTLPVLSYREVSELAYYGAKVLHPKSIRPVIEAGITLRVRNTFNPEHPGTLLTGGNGKANGTTIKAVTAFRGMKLVTVEGRGMLGVPGVAARIFSAVATTGATVPLITEASSEQSLTFAVPCEAAGEILAVLERELAEEIRRRNIDQVWATEEVVIVTAVCPGMRHRLGVAGRIFSALGDAGVNVLAIAHGSSDVSISLVVTVADAQRTIRALHRLTEPVGAG